MNESAPSGWTPEDIKEEKDLILALASNLTKDGISDEMVQRYEMVQKTLKQYGKADTEWEQNVRNALKVGTEKAIRETAELFGRKVTVSE